MSFKVDLDDNDDDSFDIVIPTALLDTPNDCTVIVQIHPDQASHLDFEGQSGAIGRFEASLVEKSLIFDFKGYQYKGVLHPGPTCATVSFATGSRSLKVDTITDEFVILEQTKNVMAQLNAKIVEGTMDEDCHFVEEDVNIITKSMSTRDCKNGKEKPKKGKRRQANEVKYPKRSKRKKAT
mmetsp:Transcript_14840/g.22669  ORF Transcript_14840/g.22669 Transcript_14840/m.22669 type:complete len:181 (-) Transcript_14840:57-599(-)|eukprot:CAMPEP_0178919714 /NCGR_PEP_ID=MMETSP0786-20121207/14597_1 /TAXON_ID=186022 /ORGANISM="Thalassionema frauenfeldii, Strain CCMP 1798" /LENGTH=180 /DNA_ID=CAMNT_0020593689 /DNA_START=88 /DNA_END=630 /DNA_ORIENTATION=+